MRATLIHGTGDVRLEDVPDPKLLTPTDAVVQVVASCICGSDLWHYRGQPPVQEPRRIGHEFVGLVTETGSAVTTVRPGDFVVAPFMISDGTCDNCLNGVQSCCRHGGFWGIPGADGLPVDGAQGEYLRVPHADGTLVATPGVPDDALVPHLLALSDVMGTGHHAAVAAGVGPGSTVVVVGDGAVGLCGVLAAHRLGAERIVAMSRHESRQALARQFGATDVVADRGAAGIAVVTELLGGTGADAVLECVGTGDSMLQAIRCTRAGGKVGYVGLPHGVELPVGELFLRNVSVGGGLAPTRAYLPELLADVLAGTLAPGAVFDAELPLAEVADGYAAMDARTAVKVLLRP